MEQDLPLQLSLQGTSSSRGQEPTSAAGPELAEKCRSRKFCFASLEADNPSPSSFPRSQLCSCVPHVLVTNTGQALAGPPLWPPESTWAWLSCAPQGHRMSWDSRDRDTCHGATGDVPHMSALFHLQAVGEFIYSQN